MNSLAQHQLQTVMRLHPAVQAVDEARAIVRARNEAVRRVAITKRDGLIGVGEQIEQLHELMSAATRHVRPQTGLQIGLAVGELARALMGKRRLRAR